MLVTIRDVAARAQVSAATVSRAFSVPELVHAETRERVLQVAEELGYTPNRAARGLITGRTGNIGVVVPDLSNPYFSAVLKGANARAREADHVVFLADTEEDPRLEEDLVRAMAKQVDGLVLASSRMSDDQIRGFLPSIPMVFLNRRTAGAPAVVMDTAGGCRDAVAHLAALGHRRIAYLAGPRSSWSNQERRRGVRRAARALSLDVVPLGPFAPDHEGGLHAADLALAAGATAVVAFNDLMALGVLNRLRARGVGVPEEVSVVGFDGIPMAAMAFPALTTVTLPMAASGRVAVELLLDRLAQPRTGAGASTQRVMETHLLVRGTTAPPPAGVSGGQDVRGTT